MRMKVMCGETVEHLCGQQLTPLNEVKRVKALIDGNEFGVTYDTVYSNHPDFVSTIEYYSETKKLKVDFYLEGKLVENIDVIFKFFNKSIDFLNELSIDTTPENIYSLEENQVFVFGSNTRGVHGKGAAKLAQDKFGAIFGQGDGLQGQSYGIPTRGYPNGRLETLTLEEIKPYVDDFIDFAKKNPTLEFLVTKIGCGLAGLKVEDMANLFKEVELGKNIILPSEFITILRKDK